MVEKSFCGYRQWYFRIWIHSSGFPSDVLTDSVTVLLTANFQLVPNTCQQIASSDRFLHSWNILPAASVKTCVEVDGVRTKTF